MLELLLIIPILAAPPEGHHTITAHSVQECVQQLTAQPIGTACIVLRQS